MKQARLLPLLFFAGLVGHGAAQTFDNSGDGLLSGQYYFRQVFYIFNSSGSFTNATTLYGTINFDGKGNYSISGDKVDAATGSSPLSYSASGTYTISASGMGYIGNSLYTGDQIYGLVSTGIFVGSSTETAQPYSDLFVAAQLSSPQPTNATLSGTYTVSYADPWTLSDDALFQFSSDGAGNTKTINAAGWGLNANTGQASPLAKSYSGTHYTFTSGAANLTFGSDGKTLLPTGVLLYISPDGNFIFGGAANGFDMFVGVRASSGTPTFGSLYYVAGIDFDSSIFQSYYGALDALSSSVLEHQRIFGQDFTFAYPYSLKSDGTYDDIFTSQQYFFGLNGAIRIGFGTSEGGFSPFLGFSVAIQAPSFTGSGVYLNPTGVVNAASSAPFTAGLSPGELITLYGTGLAPSGPLVAAQSIPLLKSLNGVSVQINSQPAPLLYVSATQISAIVPYGTSGGFADIQVLNNGVASNTVSEYLNLTSPGIFTIPAGGLGQVAALHPDYSLISPSSPAQSGETIQVFLTGLGAVNPTVSDGAAGAASEPLNRAASQPTAHIQGTSATVTYAGLAPNFAGLYQVNLTIPAGLTSGSANLEIAGPDSDNFEALIQIGSPSTAAVQPAAQPRQLSRASARSRRIHGSMLRRNAR